MAASVYKLVFQDHDYKKLAPSKLEIGTHTTIHKFDWLLYVLPGTFRFQMSPRSNILCGQQ